MIDIMLQGGEWPDSALLQSARFACLVHDAVGAFANPPDLLIVVHWVRHREWRQLIFRCGGRRIRVHSRPDQCVKSYVVTACVC